MATPRPIRNATPGRGTLTRCYKAVCAVCGRTEVVDGHDKDNDAEPQLREKGWKETTRLTDDDRRHWICRKHHEGGYKIYRDVDADSPVEIEAGDLFGVG